MVKAIQKVVLIGNSLGVVLPADKLRKHNIKKGDDVEITFNKVN